MSPVRRLLAGVAALLAMAALAAAPALAAQRVEVVDVPSLAGNVDLAIARTNRITKLQARVLLPDGYDAQPDRRWPVLYLLHGVGDNSGTWLEHARGDAAARLKGLPAIVVMPEGGRGYATDAWLGGSRQRANWGSYFLDEVLPTMEARYRIASGREHHTIAGLSMGAYGATLLGAQLPSYFGTILSFSGLYNLENPFAETLLPYYSTFSYTRQWGRYRGPYARAHSPLRLLDNLHASRLYVSTGNGLTGGDVTVDLSPRVFGGSTEVGARIDADAFVPVARARGVDVTYRRRSVGIHYWPYWRRELTEAVRWGAFGEPPSAAVERTHFSYLTMASHGNAWGLGFQFSTPPTTSMVLTRDGQHLTATGSGEITITPGAADADASGAGTRTDCSFTATLPFERELPAGC